MSKNRTATPRAETSFGFRTVAENERQDLVNDVFSSVAQRYDRMNDLMSAGVHRLWKDDLAALVNPPKSGKPFQVLDVAGGTGDIALRVLRRGGPGTRVTVADISPQMVAEGVKRARRERLDGRCSFSVCNAEALAFADNSFDAYTIAFGIRNVTHLDMALSEAYRVLKPGGRFICLEFSHVDVPGLAAVYDAYSMTVIPALGHVMAGNGAAYRYLVESIRQFPDAVSFEEIIGQAGFGRTSHRLLSGGIVAIHSGWKI